LRISLRRLGLVLVRHAETRKKYSVQMFPKSVRVGGFAMKMEERRGFRRTSRGFAITFSLQEGYDGGPLHQIEEVPELIAEFIRSSGIEFGCEILPSTVIYSYRDDGKMIVHVEPAVKLTGLFPPNKFERRSDSALVGIVAKLAAHLAGPLGQTSFHAEVCGKHYAWKVAGKITPHEAALEKQIEATS
jgi:hypothetical protein